MNNPEIWTIKMADHPQDDFVRLSAYKALDLQMAELMVENARLKAEVERLNGVIKEVVKEAQENSDRYVRRLNEEAAHPACVAMNRKLGDANNEIHRLKAEVDRLRKAGDAMAEAMWYGDAERSIWVKKFAETEWNAAKEGKQP